jgi:hypothetical protein
MPLVLTEKALIVCSHLGTVQPTASQHELAAGGGQVLVTGDLEGAPISGCTLASPGSKPCSMVAATLPGGATATLRVSGKPALLATARGTTDSSPPGTWSVRSAGQTTLHAS